VGPKPLDHTQPPQPPGEVSERLPGMGVAEVQFTKGRETAQQGITQGGSTCGCQAARN